MLNQGWILIKPSMAKLNIAILQGTTRQKRQSIKAARLVYQVAQENKEVEAIFVDPVEFNFPADGNDKINKDPKYTKITKNADGFFIVTPEYNHSFPGTLKRMLDSELKNYIHKPVAIAGVSSGPWGGVRAIENLLSPLREMGMVTTFTDVQFPNIKDVFNDQGELEDKKYIKRIKRALNELVWMARVLKWGRQNLESRYH